jgi:cell pole-organizing protein PopZ
MTALAKGNEPSMEEILASIRRIIADDQQATLAEKPEEQAAAPPVAMPAPEPEPEEVLDLAIEAEPLAPEPEPQGQDDVDFIFADVEPEPEPPPPPPVAPAPPVMAAAPPPPPPAYHAPEPPAMELLSAAASASVAGAFSSLSNTLLTGNARTLEDLVKDMMRPMLKTWLDDNLPTIVERLVKAEIERVARGGR